MNLNVKKIALQLTTLTTLIALGTGCATVHDFREPGPNLSLRGEEAQKEFQKHQFRETFWFQTPHYYEMGPHEIKYSLNTLRPMMENVSPASINQMDAAYGWRTAFFIVSGVGLASTIGFWIAGEEKIALPIIWGTVGAQQVTRTVFALKLKSAAENYNRDLREKLGLSAASAHAVPATYFVDREFAPVLAVEWGF